MVMNVNKPGELRDGHGVAILLVQPHGVVRRDFLQLFAEILTFDVPS